MKIVVTGLLSVIFCLTVLAGQEARKSEGPQVSAGQQKRFEELRRELERAALVVENARLRAQLAAQEQEKATKALDEFVAAVRAANPGFDLQLTESGEIKLVKKPETPRTEQPKEEKKQ